MRGRAARRADTQRAFLRPLRSQSVAYIAPIFLAVLAAQTWFEPGKVIAVGDLPPPVEPSSQYRSHWNQVSSGEGGPSFTIVNAPYLEALRLATAIGLSEEIFQRLWITALVAGGSAALVFFAFSLTSSRLVAGAAGVFGLFNAYRLITIPDSISLTTMLLAALLGGLLLRASLRLHHHAPHVLSFALASVGAGFVAANPPQLFLLAVWLGLMLGVVAIVGGVPALARGGRFLAKAAPVALVLNVWWLVPTGLTVFSHTFQEQFAAAGINEWAWTHAQSSLANVVTLTAAWPWAYPEIFPYLNDLLSPPLDVTRYAFPILAIAGVALARPQDRRVTGALALAAVPLIWMAKGLHPPLDEVSAWMYEAVPGYWLLREPFKVFVLLTVVFAVLAGNGVARLLDGKHLPRLVGPTLAVALVGSVLAFTHPLFTGAVITEERGDVPSGHVRVPDYWKDVTRYLNGEARDGKVLVLPQPDYYQLRTTWGYHGVPFARFALERPVVEPLPGGYLNSAPSVAGLVASIENDLERGRTGPVTRKLRALGARYVLLRRDLDRSFGSRRLTSPRNLARGLADVPGLRVRTFGELDLYEADAETGGEVFAAAPVPFHGPPAFVPEALETSPNIALVGAAAQNREASARVDATATVFLAEGVAWRVSVRGSPGAFVVRLTGRRAGDESARAGHRVSRSYVRLRPPGLPFLLVIGDRAFAVTDRTSQWRQVATLAGGGRTTVTALSVPKPQASSRVGGRRSEQADGLPAISYDRVSPSHFRVRVSGAREPFLLVATETYADGWRLEGAGRDARAVKHVVANGYANGWLVPWRGTYELDVYYGPERVATAALWTSALLVPLAALAWVALRNPRGWRRPGFSGRRPRRD